MHLLPQPQKITSGEGFYRLCYSHRITMDTSCPPESYDSALALSQEVEEATGFRLMVDRRSGKAHAGIHLHIDPALGNAEGYALTVDADGVRIAGGSAAGLHYGIQTLRQIIRQEGCVLPWVTIEDHPALPARGLFYDVTRGRIPTMAFLKGLAEKCSHYKLNQLHLYIEHCFLFDGLGEVWRDDTPLTAGDILELDAYCRRLHVELVPSVVSLGHLYKVLRTKAYSHLAELPEADGAPFSFHNRMAHHTLDVCQEESLRLVFQLFDEYAALFTSRRFNLNGDEPFDLGRGRGQARAQEIGAHQMYVDWIGKVCAHIAQKGLQPMFWGDVILAEPETIRQLPADLICMNWDYDIFPGKDHAAKLEAAGANQYLCPGAQGWNQFINFFHEAYLNIRKMAQLAHDHHAQGLLVTEWGDYGHVQDPESSLPGILYAAAMGWNREIPSEETLDQAISVAEYGDPTGSLLSLLKTLSQQRLFTWWYAVQFTELQSGRLVERTMEDFWNSFASIREQLPLVPERNLAIDSCLAQLGALMPQIRERRRLAPYSLMADGMKLLNRFGCVVAGNQDRALAADLECWYQEYKTLWRRTSRESELYRIGEVIFWMADYCRK